MSAHAKYDWWGAGRALTEAISALYAASRHGNHWKRANVLKDLRDAEAAIQRVRQALGEASGVDARTD